MPRFFVDNVSDGMAHITGEDAKHITRSLRSRVGDVITLCDSTGKVMTCEIESLGDEVLARVIESFESGAEPSLHLHLFQALTKGDKLELVIQKAVELGAGEITPVLTRRCVSRPDKASAGKKLVRWQKIAQEAAKQAGRGIIPTVNPVINFEEAITMMKQAQRGILFYEGGGEQLNAIVEEELQSLGIMVGSEGGFEDEEVALAKREGIHIATLGKRILRCETAPIAAISIIMNLTGNI